MNFFWGYLEDNAGIFSIINLIKTYGVEGLKYVNYPVGFHHISHMLNQPIIWLAFLGVSKLTSSFFTYNLFILIGLVLNIYFIQKLYNRFLDHKFISFLLALVAGLSPYFYYQSAVHMELIHVWTVALTLDLLLFGNHPRKNWVLGCLLLITTLISNYLGFFSLILVGVYYVLQSFLAKNEKLIVRFVNIIKGLFPSLLLVLGFYVIYSIVIHYSSSYYPVYRSYTQRTFEDYFIFSTRPWYYFLPSDENPFFGYVTKNFFSFVNSHTTNFLFNNYFKTEHSASFLGWANILFMFFGFKLALKDSKKGRLEIIYPAAACVTLFLISLPPFVQIGNFKAYTPNYLIWLVFPVFRVTARMGIFILMLVQVYTGYFYIKLFKKKTNYLVFIICATLFTLAQFFIPVTVTYYTKSPQVFDYIDSILPKDAVIVTYPNSSGLYSLFWLRVFKRPYVNPKGFLIPGYEDPVEFTDALKTDIGLAAAKKLGATYLVVYNDKDTFENLSSLDKIATFPAEDTWVKFKNSFLEIDNLGAAPQAEIYRIK